MSQDSNSSILGCLVIGPILIGVGYLIGFLMVGSNIEDGNASKEWPTAEGVILTSKVITKSANDGTTYRAEVVFKYKVDGKKLKSSSVTFGIGGSTGDSTESYRQVNEYPVGKTVSVYYDPDGPAKAVLEPGVPTSVYIANVVKLALICVGILLFVGPLGFMVWAFFVSKNKVSSRSSSGSWESSGMAPPSGPGGSSRPDPGEDFDDAIDIQ